ncbi:hypothetical protein [Vibrio sp. EA2]|uniref:hypothetical protein n=1 Tax=Vibrio sp. EA2 TaxID=3079860 RepID=UPI002949C96E|nr:hypothetical protein [Vibrio sp. EA2]MDV6251061.1 hypothetical protein [Vibrio sp. EA2]
MEDYTDDEKHINDQAIALLVAVGYLEEGSPTHGILKQYLDKGYNSLTKNQRYHFHETVEPLLNQKCNLCGEVLSLDDLASEIHQNVKLCGYHRYQVSKDD